VTGALASADTVHNEFSLVVDASRVDNTRRRTIERYDIGRPFRRRRTTVSPDHRCSVDRPTGVNVVGSQITNHDFR